MVLLRSRNLKDAEALPMPANCVEPFRKLREHVASHISSSPDPTEASDGSEEESLAATYNMAIDSLETSFKDASVDACNRVPLVWPVVVSNRFVAEMTAHRPFALVLIAHWGALLHSLRTSWVSGLCLSSG